MKKYILLTLVIILFSSYSKSQGYSSERLRLGAKVDPIISWMKSDDKTVSNDGVNYGVNAGLQLDYYFQEQYALSTGLTINSVGGKLFFNNPITFNHSGVIDTLPENMTINYKLQYLEIPLHLKLISREVGNTKYFAKFGFSPQLNIKATADANALNDTTSMSFNDETINDEINLFNLSYKIGGGVEIEIAGDASLLKGLFYKNGFTDITKDHDDGIIDKGSLQSGVGKQDYSLLITHY